MSGVALVTGGHRGIGFGVSAALLEAGHRVALVAERAADDEEVRAALATLGPNARYFRHDVRDVERHAALLDRVEESLGPVTTLVSNAGVSALRRGDMLELEPESFDLVLGVNLRGTFFLARESARRMLSLPDRPYRSLVFVTSVNATMAAIERAEYCVSKAGAAMVAELFAVRLAPHGIGVFELRPGIIETGMTAVVKERYDARIEEGLVPAGRWGQPRDIGSVVVPLAAGAMAFATGSVIPVDGGLSIPRL